MSGVIIGVDLGGTRVRAARLDSDLNIIERHETLTLAHQGLEPTLERIKDLIRKVWPEDDSPVEGIGISAPGPLDPHTGVVVAPPNLKGWHNVPLGDILREAFNVPIYVGNDANVAALAEAARGAARGKRHAIYITVSTGIGSGIIVDGRLLLGVGGLAAEVGHIGLLLEDGRVSTPEKEAAGPALARHARRLIEAGEETDIAKNVEGDLERIDAVVVGKAARDGDPVAQAIVAYAGKVVGLTVVTLLHLFHPEAVIIGGGVSNLGPMLFDPIWQTIKDYSLDEAYWRDLLIDTPDLGEDVSIYGAAALVATHGGDDDIQTIVD